jgi:hypothetical protein
VTGLPGVGLQFYGVTAAGGSTANTGAIFSISPTGTYTHREAFSSVGGGGSSATLAWVSGRLWGARQLGVFSYDPVTSLIGYSRGINIRDMGGTLTPTHEGVMLGTGRYNYGDGYADCVFTDGPRLAFTFAAGGQPGLEGGYVFRDAFCRGPDGRYYGTSTIGGRGANVDAEEGDGVIFGSSRFRVGRELRSS